MKKFLCFLIPLIALPALFLAFNGCKVESDNEGHVHVFTNKWTSNKEYHWHMCSGCSEISGKDLHIWDDGEVTKPASETSTGITTFTCTVCGATKDSEIDKLEPTTRVVLTKAQVNALIHYDFPFHYDFPSQYTEVTYDNFASYLDGLAENTEETAYAIKITDIPNGILGHVSYNNYNINVLNALQSDSNASKYIHLTFDNSITNLGNQPLAGYIVSLYMPDTITNIGNCGGLGKLKYLRISDGLDRIFCFASCPLLETAIIPKTIKELGYWNFDNCTGLKNLVVSNSVTSVDAEAFTGCTSLEKVYFKGTEEEYHALFDGKLPTNPELILVEDYDN